MKLNDYDNSVIIGLLLGDGYIDDRGRISIEHCKQQKEYCIWKAKLLHSICGGSDIKVHEYERTRSCRKDGKHYKSSTFITYSFKKQSKSFIQFRKLLYDPISRKKTYTQQVLELLSPISLALWWLDDGCLTRRKLSNGQSGSYMMMLYTYVSKQENELIQSYFDNKYNIHWNVVRTRNDGKEQYMLRCGMKEGRKFLNIIRDIVLKNCPSMKYKVLDV